MSLRWKQVPISKHIIENNLLLLGEIQRKRRLKALEDSKGSDFVKKNIEVAGQISGLEQYRIHMRQKNSLRIMEIQKNRRIREHENDEKKKFLTHKHGLFRSVSYLHKLHEQTHQQSQARQKVWLQFLF